MRDDIWETINLTADALFALGDKATAERCTLRNELIVQLLSIEPTLYRLSSLSKYTSQLAEDEFSVLYLDAVVTTLETYNGEKARFYTWFSRRMVYLLKSHLAKKWLDSSGDERMGASLSSLDQTFGDDDSHALGDLIADPTAHTAFESTDEELSLLVSLVAMPGLVLRFYECRPAKQATPELLHFFKLFYTESVTTVVREFAGSVRIQQELARHERDLFSAMNTLFLDFFMALPVRTVTALAAAKLKCNGQLFGTAPSHPKYGQEVKLPLEQLVYITFFQQLEGRSVSKALISKNQKRYVAALSELLASPA